MNKKGTINGQIYDIVSMEDYRQCPEYYNNKFTAIEENGYLYPITNNTKSPGYYHQDGNIFGQFIQPSESQMANYAAENIIDFDSAPNMKAIIERTQSLSNMEKEVLTSSDNIFKPVITDLDTPEMKALKEAIVAKNFDIDLYEYRFGPSYNNDKRLFKQNKITLAKLKSVCENVDIKATLILEDTNSDIPNPMGKRIVVDITGGEYNE